MSKQAAVKAPMRRQERRGQHHRKAAILIIAAVVIGAVAGALGIGLASGKATSGDASSLVAFAEVEEMLAGIPQSGTTLGQPDAPVTLVEYADLQCPYCRQWATSALPTLVPDYVRTGKLRIEFRGIAFVGEDSEKALRFALAAAEKGKLWQAVDLMYWNQGHENTGWVTDAMLASVADALGANPGELERISGGSEVHAQVEHLATLAQKDRVSSTPTILVGPTGGKPETVDLQSLGPEGVIPAIDAALADTK